MIVHIPGILDGPELRYFREQLAQAPWIDGRETAGHQSSRVKRNQQLREASPLALDLGDRIVRGLERSPLFISAVLPQRVFPPLFNRYGVGMGFGLHVDNAIRELPGRAERIRTDVSATLFLSDPEEYVGGELIIEDLYGAHSVKLPAGDMVVYPASSLHRVTPIERGVRLASFFWIQSMIRDADKRRLLLELDLAMQQVARSGRDHPGLGSVRAQPCAQIALEASSEAETPEGAQRVSAASLRLTNCYHNLLRMFSEV